MAASTVGVEYKVEKLAAATKGGVDISAERCVPNLVVALGYPVVNIPHALFNVGDKGRKVRCGCGVVVYKTLHVVYLVARSPVVAIVAAACYKGKCEWC